MSSEMRECPFCGHDDCLYVEHVEGTILHPAYYVRCDYCGAQSGSTDSGEHVQRWNERALLARTEAGADGAVAWRVEWDEDNDGDAFYVTLDIERGAMGRANEAIAEGFKGVRIRRLVYGDTRPQDASGDAELLKELKSRMADIREMLMSRGIGDQRIYGCDEWSAPTVNLASAIALIDSAMQAKEAK